MTAEYLKKMPHKERNRLYSSLRSVLKKDPETYQDYVSSKRAEKTQFLQKLLIDPASIAVTRTGSNTKTVKKEAKKHRRTQWLTLPQLASPQYLNSYHHAKMYIKTCKSRPYTGSKQMRKNGVKEYAYITTSTEDIESNAQTATLNIEAGLHIDEFLTANHLFDNGSKPAVPKAALHDSNKETSTVKEEPQPPPNKNVEPNIKHVIDEALKTAREQHQWIKSVLASSSKILINLGDKKYEKEKLVDQKKTY